MKALSSISAAFGIIEFDALDDLADWLDGRSEPARAAGRSDRAGDKGAPHRVRPSGRGA